jgi:hypothetical protein
VSCSIASLECTDYPTRTGPTKDGEVLKIATSNVLYNTEFVVILVIRTNVIKSEAEVVRVDAALEWYLRQQKDAVLRGRPMLLRCNNGIQVEVWRCSMPVFG